MLGDGCILGEKSRSGVETGARALAGVVGTEAAGVDTGPGAGSGVGSNAGPESGPELSPGPEQVHGAFD